MSADSLGLRPRRLAGLVAVAEHGDLDGAALALQVTPRALRRELRDLERDAGEALLASGERTLRLTSAGRRIALSARGLLDALEGFHAAARADSATLRVAHVAHAGTLSSILDRFVAARPAAAVFERVMSDEQQLRAVAEHGLDVAVCCGRAPLPAALRAQALRRDPLVAIGADAPVDPRATAVLAPAYGAGWPAFDACVDGYGRALGRALDRAATPTGCGRELAALIRHAGARPVVVASSTLDGTALVHQPLARLQPALDWRLIWRRDDRSPAVGAFVECARTTSAALGWLD